MNRRAWQGRAKQEDDGGNRRVHYGDGARLQEHRSRPVRSSNRLNGTSQNSNGLSNRDRSPRQSTSLGVRHSNRSPNDNERSQRRSSSKPSIYRVSNSSSGYEYVSGPHTGPLDDRSRQRSRQRPNFSTARRMNPQSLFRPPNLTDGELGNPLESIKKDKSKRWLRLAFIAVVLGVLITCGVLFIIFVFGRDTAKDSLLPHVFVTDLKANISANISVSKELYETSDSVNITQPDGQGYHIKLQSRVKKRSTSESPWKITSQVDENQVTVFFYGPIAKCTSDGSYNVTWIKDNKVLGYDSFTININNTFSTSGQIRRVNSKEKEFHCKRTTGCANFRLDVSRNGGSSDSPLNDVPRICTFTYNADDGNTDACTGMTNYSSVICKTFTGAQKNENVESSNILISECDNKPCKNGTCQLSKEGTEYNCICFSGFDGRHCENEKDECQSSPCRNGATCIDKVNAYDCTCAPGYGGDICDIGIDECQSNPCSNGATCIDNVNRYDCTCTPGYEGDACEIEKDECQSSPCRNGATCIDKVNAYDCACATGYGGDNCDIDIDECQSNPCSNGATCIDNVNRYDCTCAPGYEGDACKIETDECESDPCRNGATCTDKVNGYECECALGYRGESCEIETDECQSNPCRNGATCIDKVNGYDCECVFGYRGESCEIDTDECSSDPCLNGGICVDGNNGYSCNCRAGYTDVNCGSEINECSSDPCMNGATCVDKVNGYTCNCSADYTGAVCEKVLPGGGCDLDDSCTEHAECKDGVCKCTSPYILSVRGRYCTYGCSQQCDSSTVDSYSIFGDVCGSTFKRCVNQTQYIEYCNPDDVFDPDNGVCVCVRRTTATWCNSNTPTAELENTCNKKCLNDTVTP